MQWERTTTPYHGASQQKLNTCNYYKFVSKKLHIYIPRNIFFHHLLIIHPEFF